MNEEINTKVETLQPFTKILMTIGELPTSYLMSMTYYEQLIWFTKYLQDQVIPAVNTNAEAVEELQNLFIELQYYVDHYFDNLDVQEMVDNKLDEMALDGTLADLINQEIFGEINENLDLLNSERTIFIGDSYGAGVTNEEEVFITSWIDYLILKMELTTGNYYKIATPGAGFIREGTASGYNFIESLQAEIDNITNKDTIKNIIVCGGYNDYTYQLSNIQTAITTFVDYCKQQFPNAKVYIGCIGYRYDNSSSGITVRTNLQNVVYNAYSNSTPSSVNRTNEYVYLHGVENILKSCVKNYMYSNNAHPNESGQKALANGIYQAFRKGTCEIYQNNTATVTPVNSGTYEGTLQLTYMNENFTIRYQSLQFNWTTGSMSLSNGGTKLADVTANDFIGTCDPKISSISCVLNIQDYDKGRYILPGTIFFDTDGSLMVYTWASDGSGSSVTLSNIKQIVIYRGSNTYPAIFN